MNEIIRLLKTYEVWIYLFLGLVGLFYGRKFFVALQEWRSTIFGLERENASRRLSEATSVLVLVALMAVGEFLMVSFVSPTLPGVQVLPTPTLDILTTPTITLPALAGTTGPEALTPTPLTGPVATVPAGNGCVAGQVEITDPQPNQQIQGEVQLVGTVAIADFGFYKYEYKQTGSDTWSTIAAGNQVVSQGNLGVWNTSLLVPGDYVLRIVVTDNKGQSLPACEVPVRVIAP